MSITALHKKNLCEFTTAVLMQAERPMTTYVFASVDDATDFKMRVQSTSVGFMAKLHMVEMCFYDSIAEVVDFVERFAVECSSDTVFAVYETFHVEQAESYNLLFYFLHRLTNLRKCSTYVNLQCASKVLKDEETVEVNAALTVNSKTPAWRLDKWLQT